MVSVEVIFIFLKIHFDYTVSTLWVHLKDVEWEYFLHVVVFSCTLNLFSYIRFAVKIYLNVESELVHRMHKRLGRVKHFIVG